jgi:hypothetical protein
MAKQWSSVKEYAVALMLQIVDTDDEGRFVGLSYDRILRRVRNKFPIITYNGPHKGRAIKMSVKQLREIAYSMQSENRNLRLPVRPRSKRHRQITTSRKKGVRARAATTKRRKD